MLSVAIASISLYACHPRPVNAYAWGKDTNWLRRILRNHYTGLLRGRVTQPGRGYLVLHGNDAPVLDWEVRVVRRFHLEGSRFKILYDEHERMLPGDPQMIESTLDLKGSHSLGT